MVRVDGEVVTQRQRALVAALALHREHGATVEMLVDAIWAERVPASARKSVQNQVARLRQSFGADLIVTSGDRYHLAAPTDVDRIHEISFVRSRRTRPVTSPDDLVLIVEVLANWNGEPFSDLPDNAAATAERARLEHLRSCFVEIVALHRLNGEPDDVEDAIVDLMSRTSTHPFHEQAWELLVAALHVSGRRTEAVGMFATFSAMLHAQLGVAPSHSFQRLHRAIIADEQIDPVDYFATEDEIASPTWLASA